MGSTARTLVKGTLILITLAALFALTRVFDVQQLLREALEWISSLGPWGGFFFIALYVKSFEVFFDW